ncbi:helix-turn-helix domain-containing protein [Weeksellaceae bacterium TAE3-ERU29]|nr:helix-turn-helix domain-containing protein [Weeksellaceae bacterium TAE3-ERU29]
MNKKVFDTFKPKNHFLHKYVDYYYLDIKSDNTKTEFECFPHYNNTISLYSSHKRDENSVVTYVENVEPLQIFTPVRENILKVTQIGNVHRIVIVFHPLGIQQFFKNKDFSNYIYNGDFFNTNELTQLFNTTDKEEITLLLDDFLYQRYKPFHHSILEKSLSIIFDEYEDFSIENLSEQLNISRRQLNRIFKTYLGVSPKRFHEIVVFRKVLEAKLFENPTLNFTELAHTFCYSDQSHLNKIFKKLTQNTPTQFFKKGTLLGEEDTFWHIKK